MASVRVGQLEPLDHFPCSPPGFGEALPQIAAFSSTTVLPRSFRGENGLDEEVLSQKRKENDGSSRKGGLWASWRGVFHFDVGHFWRGSFVSTLEDL